MSRIVNGLAVGLLAVGALASPVGGAQAVWIEGEKPTSAPGADKARGFSMWESNAPHLLSGGRMLNIHIGAKDVAQAVPDGGLVFAYEFEIPRPGRQNIWARIGYEWARSDFEWRVDDGPWRALSRYEATIDLVELSLWNEMAWIRLGRVPLKGGKHTIALRHTRRTDTDAKGASKPARILHALDAICITDGEFRPNGKYRPGQDHRSAEDRKAAGHVFSLAESSGPARASVRLDGLWEHARWDEYDVAPQTRLEPVRTLPEDLDALFWRALPVPSSRKYHLPEMNLAHRYVLRTRVKVPAGMTGRGWLLRFHRFHMIAGVFVNGTYCDGSRAFDTVWACDVSGAIRPGEVNEIAVVMKDFYYGVDPTRRDNEPTKRHGLRAFFNIPASYFTRNSGGQYLDMPVSAIHGGGMHTGLLESVFLEATGEVRTGEVFPIPSVSDKRLTLDLTVENPTGRAVEVTVENEVMGPGADAAGRRAEKTFAPVRLRIAAGDKVTRKIAEGWENPTLWWPDDPHLYTLRTIVKRDGEVVDEKRTTFGFREWGWDGRLITINGAKWQWWSFGPKVKGPREFVESCRRTGQNMLRYSQWASDWPRTSGMTTTEMLDLMDRNGIAVRFGGALDGEVANYARGLTEVIDGERTYHRAFWKHVDEQYAAWIRSYRRHASIFIWSTDNEVTYINADNLGQGPYVEPAIRLLAERMMTLDPTRPTMTDGGNAMRDPNQWKGVPDEVRSLGHMPVTGAHYIETQGQAMRDYPDAAYTDRHWRANPTRGHWPILPDRPLFHGEIFFARGRGPDQMSVIGGEEVFLGETGMRGVRSLFMRMLTEGYRWSDISAAWDFGVHHTAMDFTEAWQPRIVLCRQWDRTVAGGRNVQRDLMAINQSSGRSEMDACWELRVGEKVVTSGRKTLNLAPGERARFGISLPLPKVDKRTAAELWLTYEDKNTDIPHDGLTRRKLWIVPDDVPPPPELPEGAGVYVLDPDGSAIARLERRGVDFTRVESVDELPQGRNVLVVGRDAVPAGRRSDPLWQRLVLGGARLIVLEQEHPLRYRALPAELEATDRDGRVAFLEASAHPAVAGLIHDDLFCWGRDARTRNHELYKNAYRKAPRGARSLIQCDRGLDCTILAECTLGEGVMILCQALVGEKMDASPVARMLLDNLVDYAASYEPSRAVTAVVVGEDSPVAGLLDRLGLRYRRFDRPLEALASDGGLAIIEATPGNLQRLAWSRRAERSVLWKHLSGGGRIMLWGLTPEGVTSFNEVVALDRGHLIRPFTMEMVTLRYPKDPLAGGLSLRDVVMTTGEKIAWFQQTQWRVNDEFTYVVDYDDVAPFCTIDGQPPEGKGRRMPHPRNVVNGLTHDEFWKHLHYIEMAKGHEPKITFELPREETIESLEAIFDTGYRQITEITLHYGHGEPVVRQVEPDRSKQTISLPARKARRFVLEITDWREHEKGREIFGVAALWLRVKRSEAFVKRVRPLLNVGGLVRYDMGKGCIVLNQLNILPDEANPANAEKKASIARTLLTNLGASFAASKPVIVGTGLEYEPIVPPADRFTAHITADGQPGWFRDRRLPTADLSAIPKGRGKLRGVLFDIYEFKTSPVPSVLMLAGEGSRVPVTSIEGLKVGRKADALFFLHTYQPGRAVDRLERSIAREMEKEPRRRRAIDRPAVLLNRVRDADGRTRVVPVVWGEDIGPWLTEKPSPLKGAELAWSAPVGEGELRTAAYSMQWDNPRPDVAIATIDILGPAASEARNAPEPKEWGAPAVLAITAARRRE